jgi:hypothetical protein
MNHISFQPSWLLPSCLSGTPTPIAGIGAWDGDGQDGPPAIATLGKHVKQLNNKIIINHLFLIVT